METKTLENTYKPFKFSIKKAFKLPEKSHSLEASSSESEIKLSAFFFAEKTRDSNILHAVTESICELYHINKVADKDKETFNEDESRGAEDDEYLIIEDNTIIEDNAKNKYKVVCQLGEGQSCIVYKILSLKDNLHYALKVYKKRLFFLKTAIKESSILKALNSSDPGGKYHIITIFDTFKYMEHVCIIIELLSQSLQNLIMNTNCNGFPLKLVRQFTKAILKSAFYIHSMKLTHCDLKPDNILWTIKTDNNNNNANENDKKSTKTIVIKVADFGECLQIKERRLTKYFQARFYRAPETILELSFSEKIDIWSIGCIAFELYFGEVLLPGNDSYQQLRLISEVIDEIPQEMIQKSKSAHDFYYLDTSNRYQLKSMEAYYGLDDKDDIPLYAKTIEKLSDILSNEVKNNTNSDLHNMESDRNISNNSFLSSVNIDNDTLLEILQGGDETVLFFDFLKGLLQINPKKRFSAAQALRHPFITGKKDLANLTLSASRSSAVQANSSYTGQCYSTMMNNSYCKYMDQKMETQFKFGAPGICNNLGSPLLNFSNNNSGFNHVQFNNQFNNSFNSSMVQHVPPMLFTTNFPLNPGMQYQQFINYKQRQIQNQQFNNNNQLNNFYIGCVTKNQNFGNLSFANQSFEKLNATPYNPRYGFKNPNNNVIKNTNNNYKFKRKKQHFNHNKSDLEEEFSKIRAKDTKKLNENISNEVKNTPKSKFKRLRSKSDATPNLENENNNM